MNNEQNQLKTISAVFYRNNRTETGREIEIDEKQTALLIELGILTDRGLPELIESVYSNYYDERLIAYAFTDDAEDMQQLKTSCEEYLARITADEFKIVDNKANCLKLAEQLESQLAKINDQYEANGADELHETFIISVTTAENFRTTISLSSMDVYDAFNRWLQFTADYDDV